MFFSNAQTEWRKIEVKNLFLRWYEFCIQYINLLIFFFIFWLFSIKIFMFATIFGSSIFFQIIFFRMCICAIYFLRNTYIYWHFKDRSYMYVSRKSTRLHKLWEWPLRYTLITCNIVRNWKANSSILHCNFET